jgi:long-chain acyl-CoA synthetase
MTLIDLLEKSVAKYAQRPLLWQKVGPAYKATNYADVHEIILNLAAGLHKLEIQPKDRIAMLLDGDKHWLYAAFAAYYNAAINVPLSVNISDPSELKFRLLHSGARVLFVTPEQLDKVEDLLIDLPALEYVICSDSQSISRSVDFTMQEVIAIGRKMRQQKALGEVSKKPEAEDIANIIYTSGTTSDPKGVMLSHANYVHNVEQIREIFPIDENYRTLLILPWDHCFAQSAGLLPMLSCGGSIGVVEKGSNRMETLRNIPQNIRQLQPDFLLVVPALAESIKRNIEKSVRIKGETSKKLFDQALRIAYTHHGFGKNPSQYYRKLLTPLVYMYDRLIFRKIRENLGGRLRFMVGGAALLDPDIQRFFQAIGIPLYQGYGLSEAAPVVSSNHAGDWKVGSTGKALPGVKVEIRDENNGQLSAGETGEICVNGPNVMPGYYKNPATTNETIRNGWLHTGDIGYRDADGHIYVLGRQKSLLISADGKKYSPEGIEEAILTRSELIHQIMLYNEHKPYTAALVVVSTEALFKVAKRLQLDATAKVGQEKLLAMVWEEIKRFREDEELSHLFPHRWLPNAFAIIHEPFSVENRLLTPTLKMVRRRIVEVYKSLLDELYTAGGKNYDNMYNRRVISRLFRKYH